MIFKSWNQIIQYPALVVLRITKNSYNYDVKFQVRYQRVHCSEEQC